MADALKRRLALFFDETPSNHVMHPNAAHGEHWDNSFGFGDPITDLRAIVPHETDGFPARNRATQWVHEYVNGDGVGPSLFVSADGTASRLIDLPRVTGHGTFVNRFSIGIETGHHDVAQQLNNHVAWHPATAQAEDLPGMKLFICDDFADDPLEVFAVWWPTANYTCSAESRPPPLAKMIFTEWQYSTWALLARWLCEELRVPRNFPLLPYAKRPTNGSDDPEIFRRIVLADENFSPIVRQLHANVALPHGAHFEEADFALAASIVANYTASERQPNTMNAPEFNLVAGDPHAFKRNKWLNEAWLRMFLVYRGFYGHGYAGSIEQAHHDHDDCPGELFDWHRFARSVFDWWWGPFDFDDAHATTALPARGYRTATRTTPLVEYWYHYGPALFTGRTVPGIQGAGSSPNTFRLETDAFVYAVANGQLVAARMLPAGPGVSMSFALVKHEIYHRPSPLIAIEQSILDAFSMGGVVAPIDQGRIDYDTDPTTVFSLYMHLAPGAPFDFTQPADTNPDWLNRLLVRYKEADLGLTFYNSAHHGNTNAADWTVPPNNRPHLYEQWRMNRDAYRLFLDNLQQGNLAIAPIQAVLNYTPTPVDVLLGDVMGTAGTVRVEGGVSQTGVRVEVFSTALVSPDFMPMFDAPNWNPGAAAMPALWYTSEWATTPLSADADALRAIGVDPAMVNWFPSVARTTQLDLRAAPDAVLPVNGNVFHYWPIAFTQWINEHTRASEWSKYRVTDEHGNALPLPPQPRSRWV